MFDLRLYGKEIGDTITKNEDGVKKKYDVDTIYQFHVRCHDDAGNRECFNVGDLISMGVLGIHSEVYSNPYHVFKGEKVFR